MRVVRGPDWAWEDQDGGDGNLGTIVRVGTNNNPSEKIAWVQWDSGTNANYRAGLDGRHDLRIFDSAQAGVRHKFVACDGCNEQPLRGIRWKCLECTDYDLCTSCYNADTHDKDHPFCRISANQGKRTTVEKREGSTKVSSKGIIPGAKVVRAPDWKWGNQDGGSGNEGVVTEIGDWTQVSPRCAVRVKWRGNQTSNVYRLGHDGKVIFHRYMLVIYF